ncbi:hypothetical protein MJI47_30435, partial [Salmonella enterica subsp. enterica serovar Kentucky]|nr:hypothetical protein [Salmonella enterica subsp. enterica serovar Kentucky]
SSMLQDVRAMRHTEIDYITGYLLKRARVHGLAVPENSRLFEMGEYKRQDLVYEKEDLLISGPGKYPEYNFYRMAGMAIDGKDKG